MRFLWKERAKPVCIYMCMYMDEGREEGKWKRPREGRRKGKYRCMKGRNQEG